MELIQWSTLNKLEAQKIFDSYKEDVDSGQDPLANITYSELKNQNPSIRKRLLQYWGDLAFVKIGTYEFDFEFGIRMYQYFRFELHMCESDAANDNIWRYLHLKVVPDLMLKRWPLDTAKNRAKRYYSASQRLYLKTLWWYIHMLWDTDEKTTRNYEANVDISQIMDRSGSKGTRVVVYKAILQAYSKVDRSKRKELIERVLMLDASHCTTQEPELMGITLDEYAVRLYKELGIDVR